MSIYTEADRFKRGALNDSEPHIRADRLSPPARQESADSKALHKRRGGKKGRRRTRCGVCRLRGELPDQIEKCRRNRITSLRVLSCQFMY